MARRPANSGALSRQVGGSHYSHFVIQPIEFITKNRLGFNEGNVIKYVCRHPFKGGKADLEKARHILDYMIENYDEKANAT